MRVKDTQEKPLLLADVHDICVCVDVTVRLYLIDHDTFTDHW